MYLHLPCNRITYIFLSAELGTEPIQNFLAAREYRNAAAGTAIFPYDKGAGWAIGLLTLALAI